LPSTPIFIAKTGFEETGREMPQTRSMQLPLL